MNEITTICKKMEEKINEFCETSTEVTSLGDAKFSIFGIPADVQKATAFLAAGFTIDEIAEYDDEDGRFECAFITMND